MPHQLETPTRAKCERDDVGHEHLNDNLSHELLQCCTSPLG